MQETDHNYYRTKRIYSKMYRQCKVPSCQNSSFTTPEKLFLKVPIAVSARQQWLAAAGVITNASGYAKTPDYFFCEDHFELEKDIENYMAYKMGFKKRVRVKNGCLPSKFSCQLDKSNSVVNSCIKMDVLQGQNILAIETLANESKGARSGLILNLGDRVLYKSSLVKEGKCDNVEGYHEEYHKCETENRQDNAIYGYSNKYNIVNQIALCKDHDYCKKDV